MSAPAQIRRADDGLNADAIAAAAQLPPMTAESGRRIAAILGPDLAPDTQEAAPKAGAA
jgi:hypothetical protein